VPVPTPLIALVGYHLPLGRVTKWDSGAYAVPEEYVWAVKRAGGRPALVAGPETDPMEDVLAPFDGLLLVGGGDVDPSSYGAVARHPALYGLDEERDRFELDMVRAADRIGLPTLAICRGLQAMNVAFGGTLHQHLADEPNLMSHRSEEDQGMTHPVKVLESSRLASAAGQAALEGWSGHHQGIDRLGEGLVAVGWTGDGLVEAVEREVGWMVGVQWHPERTAPADPANQGIFDAFVERAQSR
jgi:putative glutamine amidotransferase